MGIFLPVYVITKAILSKVDVYLNNRISKDIDHWQVLITYSITLLVYKYDKTVRYSVRYI